MKRQLLGLDINDEHVAAVVVELRGQERFVTASGVARFDDREELAEVLPALVEQIGWKEGPCVCGISLSCISLRNLTIPFTDKRKITQILPLELEDQLISPVGEQVVEYIITGTAENESHLLVTGLEKDRLQDDLDLLSNSGLNPDSLTIRSFSLAEQFMRGSKLTDDFLLIDAGFHAVNIVAARDGQVVFARRLPYPDRMFTVRPFSFDETGPKITHYDEAMECIGALCDDIKRSMGLYKIESGDDLVLGKIVLSGSMAMVSSFREKVGQEFGITVQLLDLRQHLSVKLAENFHDDWEPRSVDHALALALQGSGRKIPIDFRKDEFSSPKLLLASKMQLAAALLLVVFLLAGVFAYMGYDYRSLNSRYTKLGDRMKVIFKDTFPEVTRIVDPLVQMKTRLRDVQAPSIATPIFSGDKRTLNILADISGRIPGDIEIHVSRMVVDKESVVIKGTTDTFNNVNLIQGVLRKSPVYDDVDIVSAAAEKDSGLIRFELKLQTAGAS